MTALIETERPQKVAAAVAASLEGVTHRYGKTVALDNVTIAIPAGQMTGLIGPDGVGKSTLLGLIAGVRKIQTGEVRALDGDLKDEAFRQGAYARIAYMPQGLGRNLYPTLSVFENMDFIGRLFGQGEAERKARIDDLTRSTGLDPFLERPAGKLSGGMKQKLSLCCSLIHDPDLLILDEPTTGVDPLSRRQFWELIDRIRGRRPQMSVVVATAYMDEAEQYAWLAAMDGGHVIATGSPAEIKSRVGAKDLETAFIALLPEEKRKGHKAIEIPPLKHEGGTPAIEAVGLTKRFDKFVAVDHVSFKIEKGEIFGFLGSNGCGKSTTMKMLTGLLPPTEGTAKLFGEPVSGEEDIEMRRRVGYMSQAFSLYGELSVRHNLELHAKLFDLPVADAQQARRRDARPVRAQGGGRRRAGKPAARHPSAPAIGGGHPASPRDADPGRADIGRRSGRPRPVLGIPDRSLPQRRGDDLSLHALHERGDALRPHLAHARRQGPGRGHAAGADRSPSRQVARGGVHRAFSRTRPASPTRARKRPNRRLRPRRRSSRRRRRPVPASAFRGFGPTRVAKRWRSCAIRCGSPLRCSIRSS